MAVNTVGRPGLPDLVILDIFGRLPTKAAVRFSLLSKKWEGVLACLPILDFDEGGDQNGDNNSERHKKFVDNILIKYLELYEREKQKQLLDKFRLHMTSYLYKDANLVNNLLSLSFKRSVKEVDISLRVSNLDWNRGWPKRYYLLSRTTFLDAKSITTLTLEHVRIKNIDSKVVMPESTSTALLPSLKTVALKNVHFDRKALFSLIGDCPSIENLSLISCSFACSEICFSSSSLKMFEAKYCKASEIVVYKAVNLESVTIVSSSSKSLIERVILKKCCNLKYMDIRASHMTLFHLEDCREVKGTIRAPNLDYFSFEGYLNSKFSLEAPRLTVARIMLLDTWDGELSPSNEPWKHFPKLKDFLAEFGSSIEMILFVRDLKALMFPESFRNALSSPILPKLRQLDLATCIYPAEGKDWKELMKCFRWMSPSASIVQLEYNEELGEFV